jgi:hypothetical protein
MIETPADYRVLLFLKPRSVRTKLSGFSSLLLRWSNSALSFFHLYFFYFLIYFFTFHFWQLHSQNFGTSFPLQIKFTEHRWK